jgi:hypothetical protein
VHPHDWKDCGGRGQIPASFASPSIDLPSRMKAQILVAPSPLRARAVDTVMVISFGPATRRSASPRPVLMIDIECLRLL